MTSKLPLFLSVPGYRRSGRIRFSFSVPLVLLFLPFLVSAPVFSADKVSDGLPLFVEKELPQLEELWKQAAESPGIGMPAGFIPLSRQSRAYSGKWVQITGRLLRVSEITFPAEKTDGLHLENCYESWVLLPDERRIPVRLLSRTLPTGITPSRDENAPLGQSQIVADGIYYRLASYNAGDDFYSSPVIVAETFQVLSAPETGKTAPSRSPWFWKGIALGILFSIWCTVRFFLIPARRRAKRTSSPNRNTPVPDPDFRFEESDIVILKEAQEHRGEEPSSGESSAAGKIVPILLLAFFLSGTLQAEPDEDFFPAINRSFWEGVTPIDTESLLESDSETSLPFEESLQILLTRLRNGISPGLLAKNIAEGKGIFDEFPARFGVPVRIGGKVTQVTPKRLDVRGDFAPLDIFRVELDGGENSLVVFTAEIPKGWGTDGSEGVGQTACGIGIFFERYSCPVIAAARLGWLGAPTPLGRLGFDLSLFDQVEAHAVGELSKLSPGPARKQMLRNFRLTPDDRYPFYGLLAAAAKASHPAAGDIASISAVDLFNRPADSQQKLVTLTGHLRRAQQVLVPDEEIQALYGLDHYYELYLFTADSQDYPILFCVPELPTAADGTPIPTGSGPNYRQEVTLTGFLYKPWAYRIDTANSTLAPGFLDSDKEGKSWIAVPLMIGLGGTWTPDQSASAANTPFSQGIYYLLSGFLFLVILYMLLRRRRSKPIRFTVGGNPDLP